MLHSESPFTTVYLNGNSMGLIFAIAFSTDSFDPKGNLISYSAAGGVNPSGQYGRGADASGG